MEIKKSRIKAAIFGGDKRLRTVAARLGRIADVMTWCVPDTPDHPNGWKEAAREADLIVLPLPVTADGIRLNIQRSIEAPTLTEIIDKAKKTVVVAAGKVPPVIKQYAAEAGVRLADYFELEEVQIKNAVPTAEGAVEIAMRELPRTVMGAKAAVIGYGRVGRTLARTLTALKADVTCAARSEKDLAWSAVDGCRAVPLAKFTANPPELDVIFNTVPSLILSADVIARLRRKPLIIDLAASPGGTDFRAADEAGIKAVLATALPGKTSPETAGEIIADAIVSLLEKEAIL